MTNSKGVFLEHLRSTRLSVAGGLVAAFLAVCVPAQAQQAGAYDPARARVAQTGQTAIFLAGDDGDLQRGVRWSPATRFTDMGDGTITDNLTRLVWLRNANCGEQTVKWATALAWVAEMNSSGTMNGVPCGDMSRRDRAVHQSDWRLPNVNELVSLVDRSHPTQTDLAFGIPVLPNGHPFVSMRADVYWSSTSFAQDDGSAWVVSFVDGGVYRSVKDASSGPFYRYVLVVRGGR